MLSQLACELLDTTGRDLQRCQSNSDNPEMLRKGQILKIFCLFIARTLLVWKLISSSGCLCKAAVSAQQCGPLQIRLTPIPRALFKYLPGHILSHSISCWADTQLLYTSSTIQAIQSRVPLVLSLKATHRGIA